MNPIKKIKIKPLTTIEIECAVAKYFGIRQNIIVPNISWGFALHECDLLIVRKSGVAIEVEIKVTKADFLKDFQKFHNHIDKQNRITNFYYAMPVELYEKIKNLIPENAGIITCKKNVYHNKEYINVSIIKSAKKIKGSRKLTQEEQFKIAKLGAMRIFTLKNNIIKLKNGR